MKPEEWPDDEESNFLRDIINRAGDDAPVLTYADWLDDHYQEEAASSLRKIVALRVTTKKDDT